MNIFLLCNRIGQHFQNFINIFTLPLDFDHYCFSKIRITKNCKNAFVDLLNAAIPRLWQVVLKYIFVMIAHYTHFYLYTYNCTSDKGKYAIIN